MDREIAMATTDLWQRISTDGARNREWARVTSPGGVLIQGKAKLWMLADVVTVLVAATMATLSRLHTGPLMGARSFWHGKLFPGESVGILLGLLCGFIVSLLITSHRLQLYTPTRLGSALHEQRLSMQACLTAGLLLTGALYISHAAELSRAVVVGTLILVMIFLSMRRLAYRMLLKSRFSKGIGTRNVLIVGSGSEARALRSQLQSARHLGYTFRGYISSPDALPVRNSPDVVGCFEELFDCVRRRFVDEIFITSRCNAELLEELLLEARNRGITIRMVPDLYDGLAWTTPVEYIGQFPTLPIYRTAEPEIGMAMKRGFDIVFSTLVLLLLSPVLLAIAIAVKLDSKGPVFYGSERIGKKASTFRCFKFRTMVPDADKRRLELMKQNERAGILFKMAEDPRITRVGKFLRKYSLDELPQFFNVLIGDMSVVGPRPPIASEVRQYKLSHLRRLDVTPGITGLWQVQGRQDPSFESYISLDVTYIENWNIWLDFKIIVRTIGVMLAGTGV